MTSFPTKKRSPAISLNKSQACTKIGNICISREIPSQIVNKRLQKKKQNDTSWYIHVLLSVRIYFSSPPTPPINQFPHPIVSLFLPPPASLVSFSRPLASARGERGRPVFLVSKEVSAALPHARSPRYSRGVIYSAGSQRPATLMRRKSVSFPRELQRVKLPAGVSDRFATAVSLLLVARICVCARLLCGGLEVSAMGIHFEIQSFEFCSGRAYIMLMRLISIHKKLIDFGFQSHAYFFYLSICIL